MLHNRDPAWLSRVAHDPGPLPVRPVEVVNGVVGEAHALRVLRHGRVCRPDLISDSRSSRLIPKASIESSSSVRLPESATIRVMMRTTSRRVSRSHRLTTTVTHHIDTCHCRCTCVTVILTERELRSRECAEPGTSSWRDPPNNETKQKIKLGLQKSTTYNIAGCLTMADRGSPRNDSRFLVHLPSEHRLGN